MPSTLKIGLAALLIVGASFAAYSNSFDGVFVFDDEPAIAQNQGLRSLSPLSAAVTAPKDTTLAGRPVATLTFALDYALSGGTLTGFHRTNLLIQALAGLLAFGVTRRTLTRLPSGALSSSAFGISLAVALLFVVHPLQTAAVTYIVQRVESLMGLFYLATLYAAIRSTEPGPARGFWTALAVLACFLGMGSKEAMVTAPLAVALWDRTFLPSPPPWRSSLYAGLAASWLPLAFLVAGDHRSSSAGFGFPEWPWWRYLLTQLEVIPHYLRLVFDPRGLTLDYEWPAATPSVGLLLSAFILTGTLAIAAWDVWRRRPLGFPVAWFFLVLAPTSSVLPIPTEVAAEHRMYLPLLGVLWTVIPGLSLLGTRVARGEHRSVARALPALSILSLAAVVALLVGRTRSRNEDYGSYERIWADTVEKRPDNARARNNYATVLLAAGRYAEAEPHLRVASSRDPDFAEAHANLGVALAAQGRVEEGIETLQRALALRPDYVDARRNLAEACALSGRLADAVFHYSVALESRPDDVGLLNRVAWILATAPEVAVRNGARARALAERAVRLTGGRDVDSLDTLAAACAEVGDFAAAEARAREALDLARVHGPSDLPAEISLRAASYSRKEPFRTPGGRP